MSGTNAIHGIVIVGAMLVAASITGRSPASSDDRLVLASANVVGGFVVTDRMLGCSRSGEARALAKVTNLLYLITIVTFIPGVAVPVEPTGDQIGAAGCSSRSSNLPAQGRQQLLGRSSA
jgi:hypothetical protein